jgi:hypothetical protein
LIVNKRKMPQRVLQEEALLRCLPSNHKKRDEIEDSYRKGKRGYRGELDLDYYLEQLPEKEILVFQGIHLKSEETTFQIDTLIITPCVDKSV